MTHTFRWVMLMHQPELPAFNVSLTCRNISKADEEEDGTHLFVHLDVQPIGHLVILENKTENI